MRGSTWLRRRLGKTGNVDGDPTVYGLVSSRRRPQNDRRQHGVFTHALAASRLSQKLVSVFLIASLGGAIAGGVLGGLAGGLMGAFGAPTDRIVGVVKILAFSAAVPISFFTFRGSVSRYIIDPMLARAGLPPVD